MSQPDQSSGKVTRLPTSRPPAGEPPSAPHDTSLPRPRITILDLFWYLAIFALFPTFFYANYLCTIDTAIQTHFNQDFLPVYSNLALIAILIAIRVSASISHYDTIPLGLLFFGVVVTILSEVSASPDYQTTLARTGAALLGLGAGFYLGVSMGQRKLIDDKSPK